MLVTGGSGYLGSEVLHQTRHAVGTYLNSRFPGGVQLDVRDREAVTRAVAAHDIVIHTAYVQDDAATIVDGTTNVADAC